MSNLKEIRGRISSVKGTLKITSAMRMVSSAKLISAMKAVGGLLPYENALKEILDTLLSSAEIKKLLENYNVSEDFPSDRIAVILITSNQNLCGSFNANLVKLFEAQRFNPSVTTVYAIGKYGYKAVKKLGFETVNCSGLSEVPDYSNSSDLADKLTGMYLDGKLAEVKMIYSHFVSRAVQKNKVETYLPLDLESGGKDVPEDLIIEPDPVEFLKSIFPMVMRLKVHSSLLDALAAEHAARTMAMQTASDNAEDLIAELSLQYNKLRQQEITSQILDLVAGRIEK